MKRPLIALRLLVCGACLLGLASVSSAQGSGNEFRGTWRGALSANIVLGVPEEHAARLSMPVEFELRVFNRGRAEVYFISDNDEWEMDLFEAGQRNSGDETETDATEERQRSCGDDRDPLANDGRTVQLQQVGLNGAILVRFPGATDNSQHAFSFNLTRIDDETLLVDWSKISTRCVLRNDGLDQLAFAGTDELRLVD